MLAATLILVLALIGLSIGTALLWRERQATAVALAQREQVVTFLTKRLFGSIDPTIARGRAVTVADVLANAEKERDAAFTEEPEIEATIRQFMGVIYNSLDKSDYHFRMTTPRDAECEVDHTEAPTFYGEAFRRQASHGRYGFQGIYRLQTVPMP